MHGVLSLKTTNLLLPQPKASLVSDEPAAHPQWESSCAHNVIAVGVTAVTALSAAAQPKTDTKAARRAAAEARLGKWASGAGPTGQ